MPLFRIRSSCVISETNMVPPRTLIRAAVVLALFLLCVLAIVLRWPLWHTVRAIAGVPTFVVQNETGTTLSDVEVLYFEVGHRDDKRIWACGTLQPGGMRWRRWWFSDDLIPVEVRYTTENGRHALECDGGYAGACDELAITIARGPSVNTRYLPMIIFKE
jgi:hypothetical protein